MKKTFGIIGAGNIGQSVAQHLLKAGHKVTLANSRGPETLKDTIATLGDGAVAGTQQEAANQDIVILAIPWAGVPSLANVTDWKGKIVIDATNQYISMDPLQLADLGGKPSTQVVAETIKGARVTKAFNTLWFKILVEDPKQGGGDRVILVSGDDEEAKKEIIALIESLGFAGVDVGPIAASRIQEQDGLLGHINLVRLVYDVNS